MGETGTFLRWLLCACALALVLPSVAEAAMPQVNVRIANYPNGATSPPRLAITGQDGADEVFSVAFNRAAGTVVVTGANNLNDADPSDACTGTGFVITCDISAIADHTWCIDGYSGNDSITFSGIADTALLPGDTLAGSDYDVELIGGVGNDTIVGDAGREHIWGDIGATSPCEFAGAAPGGDDTINDGLGADVIRGEGGNDTVLQTALGGVNASFDHDDINLGGTADTDTVSYAARVDTDPVAVQLGLPDSSGTRNEADLLDDGVEQVIGTSGDDTFKASISSSPITKFDGAGGNDTFLATDAVEWFTGGTGTDQVTYADAANDGFGFVADGVHVTADGVANDGDALGDSDNVMPDVEQVVGTPVADQITGAAVAGCWILGGSGDDTVTASSSGCTLDGGPGADHLVGGAGDDTMHPGTSGASLATSDQLTFGGGVDTLDYSSFNGVVASASTLPSPSCSNFSIGPGHVSATKGSGGDDTYLDAPERMLGWVGNDTLCAGSGDTTLDGGSGSDTLIGGAGNDTILGGAGNDVALFGQAGNDVISGGDGNDININGGAGSDIVDGDDGDDVVRGGGGSDTIRGGAGNDHLDETTFSSIEIGQPGIELDAGDNLDGGPGTDVLDGASGDDTFACSDDLLADTVTDTGGGTEVLDCSALGHAISYAAGAGIDRLVGTAGNDTLSGATVLDGGPGDDTLTAASGGAANGGDGNDVLQAGAGGSTLDGGAGSDTLRGDAGADTLHGGSGNDTLTGSAGDDVLDGGSGSDAMSGGAGTETIDFSASGDAVNVSLDGVANDGPDGDNYAADFESIIGGSGNDTLVAGAAGITILGGAGNDRLVGGDGADVIDAGAGNDTILGGPGTNALAGGSGNDVVTGGRDAEQLFGGDGVDVLDGGAGADTMSGGAGVDAVTYKTRVRSVVVTIGAGKRNDGEAREHDDVRLDVEFVTGGRGNDKLVGSRLANTLRGGAGKDTITGGGGLDKLYGDAGNDVLISRDVSAKDRRAKEIVDGGAGKDAARLDRADRKLRIEKILR